MSLRNFYVTAGSEETLVAVSGDRQQVFRAGERLPVSIEMIGKGRYLVRGENGEIWTIDVDSGKTETVLQFGTSVRRMGVLSERDKLLGSGGGAGGADSGEITVSMPGKIVKLMVSPGTEVVTGQAVLIAEAMKMENEVKSECDGVVSEVLVNVGDTVDPGQLLIRITPEGSNGK